ncbi:LacI family DNA-binding transcriptional regulator [Pseudarthrobacter sp. alpha12b]
MGSSVGIRDVALEAGVSVTTVSHVLNDVASARVSPETREKVRSTAVRLGYSPSRLARALRSRRSGVLGLVSEDVAATPHAGRIILGADQAARARGYTLMIVNTPGQAGTESGQAGTGPGQTGVESLLERQVDGILYVASCQRVLQAPAALGKVPAVLVDAVAADGSLPAVLADEYGGAAAAVEALLAAGHTRIGFLNTAEESPSARQRLQGFRDALNRAGLNGASAPVGTSSPDASGGYAAARRILAAGNPPSALFCCNDRLAMGAYRAAAERGLSIPGHLSVIGFGNEELIAANLHPGLTTVALPHYEMGAWAANRLIDGIERDRAEADAVQLPGRPDPVLLACRPAMRGSVAAPNIAVQQR